MQIDARLGNTMAARITGKTVVVTGGSRGVGLGLVRQFLERECKVVATTRNPESADALRELGAAHASRLSVTKLDTSDGASIKDWAAALRQSHSHIDVLVNNAGIYGRRLALPEFEEQDFLDNFKTNALGPFFVVQQLRAHGLLGPPGGLIVNMTSVMASHGDTVVSAKTGGGYAYRASKAALNIINHGLSIDLAPDGIKCVLMHPGYVATDMNAFSGWISIDESASGILGVLESGKEMNGRWYGYDGAEIPY
ncbi:hypothetical protein FOA52_010843 [Chlamydomonas sp. UWO 241]|nr:hypothetical protein FOA52_010843 [Chlamydomonas sp. UWO 241]